jgi:hypothetical protein
MAKSDFIFSTILKGIIIYILFIVGISIISEWLICRKSPDTTTSKLDTVLDTIKDEIKQEFLKRLSNQNTSSTPSVQPTENFINYYPTDTFPPSSEEALLAETNRRLSDQGGRLSGVSNNNELISQQYLRTQNLNFEQNGIIQPSKSDYSFVDQKYSQPQIGYNVPEHKNYNVDQYQFVPGTSPKNVDNNSYLPKQFNVSAMDPTCKTYSYM